MIIEAQGHRGWTIAATMSNKTLSPTHHLSPQSLHDPLHLRNTTLHHGWVSFRYILTAEIKLHGTGTGEDILNDWLTGGEVELTPS